MFNLKLIPLEDRIVLDAALAGIIADVVHNNSPSDSYLISQTSALPIIYVDQVNGNDANLGTSWGASVQTIQQALTLAAGSSGADQIWVSQGTYSNTASYAIPDGVVLYGGFDHSGLQISPTERNSTDVTLFQDGGVLSVVTLSGSTAVIDGVTFSGATGTDGAAISAISSNLLLFNDIFTNNIVTSSGGAVFSNVSELAIFSSQFTSNRSVNNGGAVRVANAILSPQAVPFGITAVTFSYDTFGTSTADGNQATATSALGGAISIESSTSILVDNSSFTGNVSGGLGGGVSILNPSTSATLSDNTFSNNTAVEAGGFLVTTNFGIVNTVTMTNNTFNSNTATLGRGGGALLGNIGTLSITGGSFDNNVSPSRGGAIFAAGDTSITVDNVIFTNNWSTGTNFDGGGAIYAVVNTFLSISNSTFTNSRGQFGGAVVGGGITTIDNSNFTNNAAVFDGGAISMNGGQQLSVTNSIFTNNSAGRWGGAIISLNSPSFTVSNSTFTGNSSADRGTINAESDTLVNINNNLITGNIGPSAGVGIFNLITANISQNSIYNNGGLGIDLGVNGVTLNDSGDADVFQNFPVLSSISSTSGVITIAGTINTKPGTYTLEFFANNSKDPSGFGEGEIYLGTGTVTVTSSAVNTPFSINFSSAFVPTGAYYYTATARSPANHTSEFSAAYDLMASTPNLSVSNATGSENTQIPLSINASLVDTDGSETLVMDITNVPAGALLSAGTNLGGGHWQLTPAQLAGLTITPQLNSGNFTLTVTATATENSTGDMKSISSLLFVEVDVADTPNLTVSNAAGNEDTQIPLSINASLVDTDGSETLVIDITNVPAGAMLSAGTNLGGGHWQLTPAQLAGLTITPALNSGNDFTLNVTATATETSNGDMSSISSSLFVDVAPDADTPTLTVANVTGLDNVSIPLNISSLLVDRDGSESLMITISGVPTGAVLSNGFVDQGGGVWTLSGLIPNGDLTALNGLTITTPLTFDGPFSLHVVAKSTEAENGDMASTSADINVFVKQRLWGIDKADNQLFSIGDYTNAAATFTDFGTLQYNGQAIDGSIESFALYGTKGYFVINSFNAPGSSLNGLDVLAVVDISTAVAGGPNGVTLLGAVNIPDGHRISGLAINPLTGDLFAVQKRGSSTGAGQDSLLILSKVDGHVIQDVGKMMGLGEKSSVSEDIKFDNAGNLFVTDAYDSKTYKINTANGAIVAVADNNQAGGLGGPVHFTAMAYDVYTNTMIALDDNEDVLAFGITGTNGNNTAVTDLTALGLTSVGGMDFSINVLP